MRSSSSSKIRANDINPEDNSITKNGYLYVLNKHEKIGATKDPRQRINKWQAIEINRIQYDLVLLIDENHQEDCYCIVKRLKNDTKRKFKRYCERKHNGGTELYQHSTNNTLTADLKEWLNTNNIPYRQTPNDPYHYPENYVENVNKDRKNNNHHVEKKHINIFDDDAKDEEIHTVTKNVSYLQLQERNFDDESKEQKNKENDIIDANKNRDTMDTNTETDIIDAQKQFSSVSLSAIEKDASDTPQIPKVQYICCGCGAIVKLSKLDSVQCRQCYHGAVAKQRTHRVRHYCR